MVGGWEAGEDGTETGNANEGGGPCAGVVAVLGAPCCGGGVGADTGGKGRLEKQGSQM